MSKRPNRVFSRKFKLAAVHRMLAGENVSALARELKVLRKDLTAGAIVTDQGARKLCVAPAAHPKQ